MSGAAAIAATALVLFLAGCGEDGERGSDRVSGSGGERPSRTRIEQFAKIELPPEAKILDAREDGLTDTSVSVRFTVDRDGLERFVEERRVHQAARARLPTLRGQLRQRPGWRVERHRRVLGHDEVVGDLGRKVLVSLDDPDRPVVYLIAGTSS